MSALHLALRALTGGVAVLSAACGADEGECLEGPELWMEPPSGRLCVVGDLLVEGRGPRDLAVLARVGKIGGSLFIQRNPGLAELPEFPLLTHIGGSLSIAANSDLVAVRGFPALEELGGAVYVGENPELVYFTLGDSVSSIDSLFVALNPRLTEIAGVSALTNIATDLRVEANDALEKLSMPALVAVGMDVSIVDNPALRTSAFPALSSVGWMFSVSGNDSLASFDGFDALAEAYQISIDGNDALVEIALSRPLRTDYLRISDNAALERVAGGECARLGPSTQLAILRNPVLVELSGFAAVGEVRRLEIAENAELQSITGFSSLKQLQTLQIVRNPALAGPAGWFPALAAASDVWIFGNSSLPPATVAELLLHVDVEGSLRVGDNQGEDTALDPCPWQSDGVCDGEWSQLYGRGTALCAVDEADCDGVADE